MKKKITAHEDAIYCGFELRQFQFVFDFFAFITNRKDHTIHVLNCKPFSMCNLRNSLNEMSSFIFVEKKRALLLGQRR